MRIAPDQLKAQVLHARTQWPFLAAVEAQFKLPRMLLFAVGSRETNLANIVGDGGHGYGVFQRDNRSWHVDQHYLADVHQQAVDAALLLLANYRATGSWRGACAAYNAGVGNVRKALANGKSVDAYTTGGDYGADVIARTQTLQGMFPVAKTTLPAKAPAKPVTQPQHPAAAARIYVVRAGDNLNKIAAKFGTTARWLAAVNKLSNPDVIHPGQRLRVH